MQTWQVLVGIAEAVLAFWGTWWLMHPEHKAERMALILNFRPHRRHKQLYDPAVHPNDYPMETLHNTKVARYLRAEIRKSQAELRAMQDGVPHTHRKRPQIPSLILPNAEGLLGVPWLRDGIEPYQDNVAVSVSKVASPRWAGGVSEKATPEYEAGIKRRAEVREKRLR